MDPAPIDKLFDEALERTEPSVPLSGPYNDHPWSTDHHLLKKSWDYFKERVRTIEDHFAELLRSKDLEIEALAKELKSVKERADETEQRNRYWESFQALFVQSRRDDFIHFEKATETSRLGFEEERACLEKQIRESEQALERERAEKKIGTEKFRQLESALRHEMDRLKQANGLSAQRHMDELKALEAQLSQTDALIRERDGKIDLLRNEVHRRDESVQKLQEESHDLNVKLESVLDRVDEIERLNRNLKEENAHLLARLKILKDEKDRMARDWNQEKSSWRELWDRARELREGPKR